MTVENLLTIVIGVAACYVWLRGTREAFKEGGILAVLVMQVTLVWAFFPLWMMAEKRSFPISLPGWVKGGGWIAGVTGLAFLIGWVTWRHSASERDKRRGGR